MIYFMRIGDGGPIKIGCSESIEGRLKQHAWRYGRPVSLLATLPGDRSEEARWHERFTHLRLGKTEQFRPAPDLMGAIGCPWEASALPEAVEAVQPDCGETKPTQIRFTEVDKERIEVIRKAYDLPSASDAIRLAIKLTYDRLPPRFR